MYVCVLCFSCSFVIVVVAESELRPCLALCAALFRFLVANFVAFAAAASADCAVAVA